MVTHDQDEALTMADRIVIMRDGRIEQIGEPADVYQRPATRFTASFLGASNFFRGRVEASSDDLLRVSVPGGPLITVRGARSVGNEVTVALRPEAVAVAPAGAGAEPAPNATAAQIEQVIYHGYMTHLYLRLPNGEPLIAFQQNRAGADGMPLAPGMQVQASWPEDAAQIVRDEPE
jgi:putative spermidine/putrescine transport system ATP-binding protein/spermidine/putrescine transport system ATP-binding protein